MSYYDIAPYYYNSRNAGRQYQFSDEYQSERNESVEDPNLEKELSDLIVGSLVLAVIVGSWTEVFNKYASSFLPTSPITRAVAVTSLASLVFILLKRSRQRRVRWAN